MLDDDGGGDFAYRSIFYEEAWDVSRGISVWSAILSIAFIHPQISPITQIKKKNLLNLYNLWIMFFGLSRFWRENHYHEGSQRYTKDVFRLLTLCLLMWLRKKFPLKTVESFFILRITAYVVLCGRLSSVINALKNSVTRL